jgi:WD40 repeat protein
MENGEIEFTLTGHTGRIEDMDFSADGSRLVSVASDRTFKIWDLTK